jgi:methionyl-tRNA synthetase
LTWGIDTPIDSRHKIYVWIDALVNYISALGYPDGENYKKYWPAELHLIGKGINWFHSVIWPAILLSAKIPLPKLILVHGYVTIGGEKMSKSMGFVTIDPFSLAKRYQVDAVRYYLIREIPFFEDGNFTEKALVEKTNNELVANVGNFIHRTLTFIWDNFNGKVPEAKEYGTDDACFSFVRYLEGMPKKVGEKMRRNEIDKALKEIVDFSVYCNQFFQKKEPWKTKDADVLFICANAVRTLAILFAPYIPFSCEKLWAQMRLKGSVHTQNWESAGELHMKPGHEINKPEILFRKIELSS